MLRTAIKEIFQNPQQFADKEITVCGWVKTQRSSKAIGFLEINDGGCFKGLQVVFEDAKISNFKEICKINVGAAVIVKGNLILTPDAAQPFEINATEVIIEGESTPDYPLQKKRISPARKFLQRVTADVTLQTKIFPPLISMETKAFFVRF